MHHPIDERRRHRLHDSAVLCTISGADDDRSSGQLVFAEAPLVNQTVESLLHLMRARVQLIEEKAIRLLACDRGRRAESALAIRDLRHADEILGRQLAAK